MARSATAVFGVPLAMLAGGLLLPPHANADDLFKTGRRGNIASDLKSLEVGEVLTVVVVQRAESRNSEDNVGRRSRSISGAFSTDAVSDEGELALNGRFDGRGEIRRSESFITQISVTIERVEPNGDLWVAGEQLMFVNGEETKIRVRGLVRPHDISSDNQVISTRLAHAEIDYDGNGFVSRNARPGFLDQLFGMLGLGG